MTQSNKQIVLASRPFGLPKSTNFSIQEVPIPSINDGQVLCRTIYLSLDPYMRGRMNDGKSYSEPVQLGEVMVGGTVSVVIDSKSSDYVVGDFVLGSNGWQEYAACDVDGLVKLEKDHKALTFALGVLGMPGFTAYVGLLDIGMPKAGETVVVSAASGAVGSVVGQIAKIKGCRVVGVASSNAKCEFVVKKLGFDDCVSYKSDNYQAQLHKACPDGVDIYFENVGGRVLDGVLGLLNVGARIPLCGCISYYNLTELPRGGDNTPLLIRSLLVNRVKLQGFIISEHEDRKDEFLKDMRQWIGEGKIKYREDIIDGLVQAPSVFKAMFNGKNFGKQLIRVADDLSTMITD